MKIVKWKLCYGLSIVIEQNKNFMIRWCFARCGWEITQTLKKQLQPFLCSPAMIFFLWKPPCWSLSVKNKISAQPISVSFRNVRRDLELLMSSLSTRPFMWKSSNTNANSVEKSLGLKDVSSHTSSITLVRIRFLFVINPLILLSSCYSTSTVFPCKLVLRIWC